MRWGISHCSCCLVVKNIQRCLYFLPRDKASAHTLTFDTPIPHDPIPHDPIPHDPIPHDSIPQVLAPSGKETATPVTFEALYAEFNSKYAEPQRIMKFTSRRVTRRYAFDQSDVPQESEYLQVMYSAEYQAPPHNASGKTFSRIFGTTTSRSGLASLPLPHIWSSMPASSVPPCLPHIWSSMPASSVPPCLPPLSLHACLLRPCMPASSVPACLPPLSLHACLLCPSMPASSVPPCLPPLSLHACLLCPCMPASSVPACLPPLSLHACLLCPSMPASSVPPCLPPLFLHACLLCPCSLEQLIVSRQLKGPCWLHITQPSKWGEGVGEG